MAHRNDSHSSPGRTRRNERGTSESVQWAVLTPLVMLMVIGVIQAGVVLAARTTVRQAAMAGAETMAVAGSGGGPGAAVAVRLAVSAGLSSVDVSTSVDGGMARVHVQARAQVFFDIGQGLVSADAVMPLEQP